MLTGTASLGTEESSSREREAARITPALYHLVPRFKVSLSAGTRAAVVDKSGNAIDLFKAGNWQAGVIDSLAEFIRLYSVERVGNRSVRRIRATKLLQELLGDAKQYLSSVDKLTLAPDVNGLDRSSWLCIAGVDAETRVRLRLVGKRYQLSGSDRQNNWEGQTDRILTGDGTVPLAGAVPSFLQPENVVCVLPGDLGYWELMDRAILKKVGFHGVLPKVNLVHRLVIAHLMGRSGHGDDSLWGRPMPGVTSKQWQPAIPRLDAK